MKKILSLLIIYLCVTSCMDKSWDITQDIDLTVELGTDGLGVPIDSLQRIYMLDAISTYGNFKADTDEGHTQQYYAYSQHWDTLTIARPKDEDIVVGQPIKVTPIDPTFSIPFTYDQKITPDSTFLIHYKTTLRYSLYNNNDFALSFQADASTKKTHVANILPGDTVASHKQFLGFAIQQEAFEPDAWSPRQYVEHKNTPFQSLLPTLPRKLDLTLHDMTITLTEAEAQKMRKYPFGTEYSMPFHAIIFMPVYGAMASAFTYDNKVLEMSDEIESSRIISAKGLKLEADMRNTVPLNVSSTIVAKDKDGNEMKDVVVTTEVVKAGTLEKPQYSHVTFCLTFHNPTDITRLNSIYFHVCGQGDKAMMAEPLRADQYVDIYNMHAYLTGSVILNLND